MEATNGRLWIGTILLAVSPAAAFLPAPWSALAVAVLGAGWLLLVGARRGRWLAVALLALAAGALVLPWAADRLEILPAPTDIPAEVATRYAALWQSLSDEAKQAAAELPAPSGDDAYRLEAFRRLGEIVGRAREGAAARPTLLLVDPDGEPVAWAGEGLLNEPEPSKLIRSGRDFYASFGSVTLVAVEPLDDSARPWRLVAGRSYATDRWPFRAPLGLALAPGRFGVRWSLAPDGVASAPGAATVQAAGLPSMVLLRPSAAPPGARGPIRRWPRRVAWGCLAILLLGVTVIRGLRLALPGGRPVELGGWRAGAALGLSGAAGAGAAALASGATPFACAALAGGIVLAAAAAALGGAARPFWAAAALGGGAALAVTGAAWLTLHGLGLGLPLPGPAAGATPRLDLAGAMWPGPAAMTLRAAFAALALALLLLAGRVAGCRGPRTAEEGGALGWRPGADAWAWLALGLLLAAGAVHDLLPAGLALLAAGGAAAARWMSHRPLRHPLPAAVALLLATLLAAGAWETAYRVELKEELAATCRAELAPPSSRERARVLGELEAHFRNLDLATLVPRNPDGLGREDLAFALWRRSPLAQPNALSALVVEPFAGSSSTFSFGPLVTDSKSSGPTLGRWDELRLPVWETTLISGHTVLTYAGRPWAVARYWLLPRPGFDLGRVASFDAIELGLLRGRSISDRRIQGLPETAAYGLYTNEGRALVSPWPEGPPLPSGLAGPASGSAAQARVETPAGSAWAWAHHGPDGIEVVYLPLILPVPALERVGTHAVGNLSALLAAAGLLLLLALPRPAFRDAVRRTLRSYSKRLIIVFTGLLLLPLLLLNLVILSDAEERLNREQRSAGEAALASTQRVIGDYVATLEPGFDFTTLVDDQLLMWVSRVVHHEVNLYWGSSIWASSKPELFAAGLLPERIPGEIYSRLTLLGYGGGSRTNVARDVDYLELYAPLRIPGAPADTERLFLSMPLLAQQEEVAQQLASLRRRVILASAALFGLLIAVGVVLARRFSRPIEDLVEGTRRIASGATALELAPSELELAALVDAVDQMARRIAESRSRLVREKQVVERMVENITSGVVSLDRERRVLMHNRVARELLGVEVGERIDDALAGSERLAQVGEFLEETGSKIRRTTLRLAPPEEGEEREWSLVWVPVPGEGEPTALLVVEDATEVLRGQRLQAWAEMARIIAHEIKNPLTPLRLSTEHMREVHRNHGEGFDEVFERCTVNILRQVEELRQIASEFSTFSTIPKIDPQPGDLVEAMERLVEAYRSATAVGVEVSLEAVQPAVPARFDSRLLGRAVRNLVENAVRANAGEGRVVVRVESVDGTASVAVLDSGPGVEPELLGRIFDPYFSTYDMGTGLGLPIARRIAEEHGGSINARNRAGGGLAVTIRIPS